MSGKKLVSTLFALVVITSMVVGCASATPTAAPATAAPATAAPTIAPATAVATAKPTSAPATAVATAAPTATEPPFVPMQTTATKAPTAITLTYLTSQGWTSNAQTALMQQFAQETGITINTQIIPSAQYFTVLQTKLNSGEGPDIFGGQSGKTDLEVNYNVEKNAVDLSDQPWVKTEDPLVLDQASVNGKVYGLTVWNTLGTTWVVNYNKAIFSKYNLTVPTTYAGLKSDCLTLKPTGITPIYEPMSDGWHQVLWFAELGVQIEHLLPGTAALLNSNKTTLSKLPTASLLLQQIKDLYNSGCFGDNTLSDTVANQEKEMATGAAAMTVANLTFDQQLKADYPNWDENNMGIFLMPLADNQVLNTNPAGPTMFIWTGSKHIAQVEQFFDFLSQPDSLQYMVNNDPNSPTLPFTGIQSKLLPFQQAFLAAQTTRGVVYQTQVNYVNPQWMDMGKDIVAMLTNAETPQQVLANIDQRRAQEAKAANDPNWP